MRRNHPEIIWTRYQPGPMGGMPGDWRQEQSDLSLAVDAYINFCCGEGAEPTEHQLSRIQTYLHYFINAPCWENNCRQHDCFLEELMELRERSKTLASVESIRRWIEEALDIGLDPF